MSKLSVISPAFIQEYLETLARFAAGADAPSGSPDVKDLISCYAELRFKMHGGSKCGCCNAHVRHVVPVIAEREDGQRLQYSCLCTRCIEAEKALSTSVTMTLGQATVEFIRDESKGRRMNRVAGVPARAGRPGT